MFQHTKSAMEGADTLHLLSRVEQKLDEIIRQKEAYKKKSKDVQTQMEKAEDKAKGAIQADKIKAKQDGEELKRENKIKEKEKRFKTAQDKMLKGKERMRPSRLQQAKKKRQEQVKVESDAFDEKYFEAPH